MTTDEKWMRRALSLAGKGCRRVHPNPMVGAVLVRKGLLVGEGYHQRFGLAHAEMEAIQKAGKRAQGSTLYVNLEPCAHWGKTPPCAEAILRAGIRRVVCAMRDPNPLVSGKGFQILRKGRVPVTRGVLEEEARRLNRAFITWVKEKRPFVTLKAAASLDGKTATMTGESHWITSEKARAAGHELRAEADAIAVGLETVKVDNPSLTAHGTGLNPVRIIFDSHLRAPLQSRVFNRQAPTWCLATHHTTLRRVDRLKRKGVQVLLCHADAEGRVSVSDALKRLAAKGIAHLLLEGGLSLQTSFLEAGVVDEVHWFIAPMIIGNTKRLKNVWNLEKVHVESVGRDFHLSACLPESSRRSVK